MKTKNFYFSIEGHNVVDFVEAYSFVDAKARAFKEYSHVWNKLRWHDTTNPIPEEDTSDLQQRCARLFF